MPTVRRPDARENPHGATRVFVESEIGDTDKRCHHRRMLYRLEFSEEARRALRNLNQDDRRRIGRKLDDLCTDLRGNVKKLAGEKGKYRLRVGEFRVLFTLEKDVIFVQLVKNRKDAYRN